MPRMSMIPATNGLLIIAGSRPSRLNNNGSKEPQSVPQTTTKTMVNGTTNALRPLSRLQRYGGEARMTKQQRGIAPSSYSPRRQEG